MSMNYFRGVCSGLFRVCALAAGLIAMALVAHAVPPQTLALEIKDGKLAGAGAEIIRGELAKAQFVLFGEEHGFADSPIILRAIAREGRPLGFKYHVVEVGPLSTRKIRETLSGDGIQGLHELVHEVPLGIPFLCLKDDAELASDFLGQDSKGTPFLLGVDQEFIGLSQFQLKRLVEIAPNEAARTAATKVLTEEKQAAEKVDQKQFLMTHFRDANFDALAVQFKGQEEA